MVFYKALIIFYPYTLGSGLFSVLKISKTTFTHNCSVVRKTENSFQIGIISKIEVAPIFQSLFSNFTKGGWQKLSDLLDFTFRSCILL